MNINGIISGMTPQEKNAYFEHMEKRHVEECEYMQARRAQNLTYRERLIAEILKRNANFSLDQLKEKSMRSLEIIASY